jgi:hypothetical protein
VQDLLAEMLAALPTTVRPAVRVTGRGGLPSAFRVTDLAVASMAAAGCCLSELIGGDRPLTVDRGLAAHWFGMSLRPLGWELPPLWDPVAGDYEAADGWIRLHTNAARHRAAALRVLGVRPNRAEVAAAVREWPATDLESAVVAAGGAAAEMRSTADWQRHPQGAAVRAEPLVECAQDVGGGPDLALAGATQRPLTGVRVLDLTRVLAGPVATRLLAGWGAEVLRIDPPDWDEPGVIPEMTLGKRTARLDLRIASGRATFERLLGRADVLVHGYRADALERLGFGEGVRAALRPALVDVALNAYGWTGPWRNRRGFDSLVQMSSGIAEEGMRACGHDRPTPLPVQAIDQATGYLMAAAALAGLTRRRNGGAGSRWRLSLARTAQLLIVAGLPDTDLPVEPPEPALTDDVERTSWGPARRLRPALDVPGAPLAWDLPARALGSDSAAWAG